MPNETGPNHEEGNSEPRSRFSGLHTRTYEMELLLSGAVVLGLVQLPRLIGLASERFVAGLAGDMWFVGALLTGYVTLVPYVLIGAFVFHLALRAYWIGLVGLESVFQDGIRWENVRLSPTLARLHRERVGSLARSIERTDDLCSLVFSFGFLIVSVFIYSIVVVAIAIVAATAVSRAFLGGSAVIALFWVALVVLVGVPGLAASLDKRLGPKLQPQGTPMRLVEHLVRLSYLISPLRWTGPIQLTFGTNVSPARVAAVIVGICLLIAASHLGSLMVRRDQLRFDGRTYFPVSLQEVGVDPIHYRDRRASGVVEPGVPSVQSSLIDGPFVELVIPYYPRVHNPLLAESCPALVPLRREGLGAGRDSSDSASVREAAACFGSLFSVRLDGRLLDALRWDFTIEEGSELPALVTFLRVTALPPGRHELEVVVPRRANARDDSRTARHLIPFWRE